MNPRRSLVLALVALLLTIEAAHAQVANPGSINVGSQIGTGMGGFHGSGHGGGFYHPSWGPSMPGHTMPHIAFPSKPPFQGNLVKPVTPFAPLPKRSIGYGFDWAGIHQKPVFGARPQFNNRITAPSVGLAPHYIPGFFPSSHNYPTGARPDFNALPNTGARAAWDYQSRPTASTANPSWPNQADPRWWPRSKLAPLPNQPTLQ